jgi:hypothetical protein
LRSGEPTGACGAVHPDRAVARLPDGGFEIRAAGREILRAHPSGGNWRIDGSEGSGDWLLERTTGDARGFVLLASSGRQEIGRTMPLAGAVDAGLRVLLLGDGRLFRIVPRGARHGLFELLGWETPGAYVEARPAATGWLLVATVAGGGLVDLTAISVLMAAEILDAEEPLRSETTG